MPPTEEAPSEAWEDCEDDWFGFQDSPLPGGHRACGLPDGAGGYALGRFPAEPASWCPDEEIECHQTMGHLDLVHRLQDEERDLTEAEIKVEISSWQLKVTYGEQGSRVRTEIPVGGEFFREVRPTLARWKIVDGGGDRLLWIHVPKLEHKQWTSLWFKGERMVNTARKERFAVRLFGAAQQQGKGLHADHQTKLITLPYNARFQGAEKPYNIDAETFCVGIEDFQKGKSRTSLHIHFHRSKFDTLCASLPFEETVCARIYERYVQVYTRGPEPQTLFEGELEDRIIPEQTVWSLVPQRAGKPGGPGEAYNPALRLDMLWAKEDGEDEGRAFRWSSIAGGAAGEPRKVTEEAYEASSARIAAKCQALLDPAKQGPSNVDAHETAEKRPAPAPPKSRRGQAGGAAAEPAAALTAAVDPRRVVAKFKELVAAGTPASEAANRAIVLAKEEAEQATKDTVSVH